MQENKTPARVVIWAVGISLGLLIPFIFYAVSFLFSPKKSTTSLKYQDFLLIQIDTKKKKQPDFEAVWLVRFPKNNEEPFDVTIFPPNRFRGRDNFPPDLFAKYIDNNMPETIVATREDISNAVDRLGGIMVAGESMDGKMIWKYLDTANEKDPDDLTIRQGVVVQGLLVKMTMKGKQFPLETLFSSDYPSRGRTLLSEAMRRYQPIQMENFRVNIAN